MQCGSTIVNLFNGWRLPWGCHGGGHDMRGARSVRVAVAATLVGALVVAGAASDAFDGGEGRLQAAVDDVHGYGFTGVQGLADVDGRVTTARAGVASLATGAPVPVNGYFRMGSD